MVLCDDLDETVALLAEVTRRARFSDAEVEEQKVLVGYELEDMVNNPDVLLPELLHRAAYRGHPLGNYHLCQQADADVLSPARLRQFRDRYFTSERMVLAGAGVEHELLVDAAQRHFGDMEGSGAPADVPPASAYTGGCELLTMDESPSTNALNIPLMQLALGFKGVSWRESELYATAVLQLMLGGGTSFSVGGPGKGMFARCYQNVMNRYHWVESAVAINLSYQDLGIFYLQGSAPPQSAGRLLDILLREIVMVAKYPVSPEELQRAQNQLKASLLMNLECKPILAEDIGRQILGMGFRFTAQQLIERIDAVTSEDLANVARRFLENPPTLAAFGDVSSLPSYDTLRSAIKRHME